MKKNEAKWFSTQNCLTGGANSNPRSRFSTYPLRVSRGFLQNSHKYGVGSIRTTPRDMSLDRDIFLNPTTQPKRPKVKKSGRLKNDFDNKEKPIYTKKNNNQIFIFINQ